MLRTRIINLLLIATSAIIMVAGLYYYSSYSKKRRNNFVREIPPAMIVADKVEKIHYQDSYLVGYNDNSFYLSSRNGKNLLFKYNAHTLDTSTLKIKASKDFNVYEDAELKIDSTTIFLTQAVAGNIRSGSLISMQLEKSTDLFPFHTAIPISDSLFVIRYINKNKENTLGIYNTQKHRLVEKNILIKQGEGIFSTDGILLKTPDRKVIYVYYYRNQFIVADDKLHISYKGTTIDTNTRAKIKISKVWSTGDLTMAAPPLVVNKDACANKNYLFIRSGLKADNETEEMTKKSTVIDIYDLSNGKYKFSIYLPDLDGDKLVSFKVYNKTLVALYHKLIYTFKLNF